MLACTLIVIDRQRVHDLHGVSHHSLEPVMKLSTQVECWLRFRQHVGRGCQQLVLQRLILKLTAIHRNVDMRHVQRIALHVTLQSLETTPHLQCAMHFAMLHAHATARHLRRRLATPCSVAEVFCSFARLLVCSFARLLVCPENVCNGLPAGKRLKQGGVLRRSPASYELQALKVRS